MCFSLPAGRCAYDVPVEEAIPILNLTRQYRALKAEIDAAVLGVLESGTYINGPNVAALEEEIAELAATKYAVALNSGTDALHLALRALDLGPGDEVVTTPFTFVATSEAIGAVGARPVFVDIDPATFNIDPRRIEAAITPRTRAILPVHLYGLMAPMDEISAIARRHSLAIVEDCAQAIGASWRGRQAGSVGNAGCFSFFPSKNLGAYGDGGMLVTDDAELAARVRRLRAHGASVKYHHEELGVNSRLDEIQAAILRVKRRHLHAFAARRCAVAARYDAGLTGAFGMTLPTVPEPAIHAFHQYTIRARQRAVLADGLAARGVQTMIYYPVPLHLQRVHAGLGYGPGDFPEAERAAHEVLSLPMFPELRAGESARVIDALLTAQLATA